MTSRLPRPPGHVKEILPDTFSSSQAELAGLLQAAGQAPGLRIAFLEQVEMYLKLNGGCCEPPGVDERTDGTDPAKSAERRRPAVDDAGNPPGSQRLCKV